MKAHLSVFLLIALSSLLLGQELGLKTKAMLAEFSYSYKGEAREVPLKIYHSGKRNAPVILMSHGLGGSREVGAFLGEHWAAKGFIVVAMEHEGTDRDVLKGLKRKEYFKALRKALNPEGFFKRVHDVPATLDKLTLWNSDKNHLLYQKMNLNKVGMCGHSYGAITTQALTGQTFPVIGQKYTDKRLIAAFAMSPSIPRKMGKPNGAEAKKAFGKVLIPWLAMTGTKDKSIVTPHVNVDNRKLVYGNLPKGEKYQLVLDGASHMAFSDRSLIGKKHRNPQHHQSIKAISTAFFEAYLSNDSKSQKWLKSDAVRKVLADKDTWETK